MRLPTHLVAKLSLVAAATACEPAHDAEPKPTEVIIDEETRPLDEVVRMTHVRPAVAPKYAPPQPQPKPSQPEQPVVKKQEKPRKVWTSVCGHAPQLLPEGAGAMRCGRG